MDSRIRLVQGDITRLGLDAIVNAANSSLLGGAGVDGAIHRAAGPRLLEECKTLGGCPTGEARLSAGYDLPAKFVIHTVGPIWNGGGSHEAELLASCYRESLKLAVANQIATLAFPAISCGVYGYPIEEACSIATREADRFLASEADITQVIFVAFDARIDQAYRTCLDPEAGDQP